MASKENDVQEKTEVLADGTKVTTKRTVQSSSSTTVKEETKENDDGVANVNGVKKRYRIESTLGKDGKVYEKRIEEDISYLPVIPKPTADDPYPGALDQNEEHPIKVSPGVHWTGSIASLYTNINTGTTKDELTREHFNEFFLGHGANTGKFYDAIDVDKGGTISFGEFYEHIQRMKELSIWEKSGRKGKPPSTTTKSSVVQDGNTNVTTTVTKSGSSETTGVMSEPETTTKSVVKDGNKTITKTVTTSSSSTTTGDGAPTTTTVTSEPVVKTSTTKVVVNEPETTKSVVKDGNKTVTTTVSKSSTTTSADGGKKPARVKTFSTVATAGNSLALQPGERLNVGGDVAEGGVGEAPPTSSGGVGEAPIDLPENVAVADTAVGALGPNEAETPPRRSNRRDVVTWGGEDRPMEAVAAAASESTQGSPRLQSWKKRLEERRKNRQSGMPAPPTSGPGEDVVTSDSSEDDMEMVEGGEESMMSQGPKTAEPVLRSGRKVDGRKKKKKEPPKEPTPPPKKRVDQAMYQKYLVEEDNDENDLENLDPDDIKEPSKINDLALDGEFIPREEFDRIVLAEHPDWGKVECALGYQEFLEKFAYNRLEKGAGAKSKQTLRKMAQDKHGEKPETGKIGRVDVKKMFPEDNGAMFRKEAQKARWRERVLTQHIGPVRVVKVQAAGDKRADDHAFDTIEEAKGRELHRPCGVVAYKIEESGQIAGMQLVWEDVKGEAVYGTLHTSAAGPQSWEAWKIAPDEFIVDAEVYTSSTKAVQKVIFRTQKGNMRAFGEASMDAESFRVSLFGHQVIGLHGAVEKEWNRLGFYLSPVNYEQKAYMMKVANKPMTRTKAIGIEKSGPGIKAFDFTPWYKASGRLSGIAVAMSEIVLGVQCIYADACDATHDAPLYFGDKPGSVSVVRVEWSPGVELMEIDVFSREDAVIGLVIHTSDNKERVFGDIVNGDPHVVAAPYGRCIVGFYGTYSHTLHSLGCLIDGNPLYLGKSAQMELIAIDNYKHLAAKGKLSVGRSLDEYGKAAPIIDRPTEDLMGMLDYDLAHLNSRRKKTMETLISTMGAAQNRERELGKRILDTVKDTSTVEAFLGKELHNILLRKVQHLREEGMRPSYWEVLLECMLRAEDFLLHKIPNPWAEKSPMSLRRQEYIELQKKRLEVQTDFENWLDRKFPQGVIMYGDKRPSIHSPRKAPTDKGGEYGWNAVMKMVPPDPRHLPPEKKKEEPPILDPVDAAVEEGKQKEDGKEAGKDASPRGSPRRNASPRGKSPRARDRSPRGKDSSPRRKDRSPRGKDRSPRGKGSPRRGQSTKASPRSPTKSMLVKMKDGKKHLTLNASETRAEANRRRLEEEYAKKKAEKERKKAERKSKGKKMAEPEDENLIKEDFDVVPLAARADPTELSDSSDSEDEPAEPQDPHLADFFKREHTALDDLMLWTNFRSDPAKLIAVQCGYSRNMLSVPENLAKLVMTCTLAPNTAVQFVRFFMREKVVKGFAIGTSDFGIRSFGDTTDEENTAQGVLRFGRGQDMLKAQDLWEENHVDGTTLKFRRMYT